MHTNGNAKCKTNGDTKVTYFSLKPALHEVGGSFCKSLSSFKMRFEAMSLPQTKELNQNLQGNKMYLSTVQSNMYSLQRQAKDLIFLSQDVMQKSKSETNNNPRKYR